MPQPEDRPEQPPEHKLVTIIVNTREHQVEKGKISFDQVVALAYDPVPTGPNVKFSVTYHRGQGQDHGDLFPGDSVEAVENMLFNVTFTDKS